MVTAAVLAALALYGFFGRGTLGDGDDEDRPPIVVKNGTLEFHIKNDKHDVKWKSKKDDDDGSWRPEHPKGKGVSKFVIAIVATSSEGCPSLSLTEKITVGFNGAEYVIDPRKRKNGNGANEVAVSSGATDITRKTDYMLEVAATKQMEYVKFTAIEGTSSKDINCDKATELKVWPF
jgi:hypothetical protein